MVTKRSRDFFDDTSDAWQTAMDQMNFEDATKAGIDAYLHCRAGEDNQRLRMGALTLSISRRAG